ncbi:MAG TPA: hypothetical protein VJ464_21890 [Blastocatellia bacterium]|nr:hypothetical protein [Blastocatellia bacterium]
MKIDSDCIGAKLNGTASKDDRAWDYTGGDQNQYSYRTWKPDSSLSPNQDALLVSSKIDFTHGGVDDHTVLLLVFDRTGALIQAEADMQLNLVEKKHGMYKTSIKTVGSGVVTGTQAQITSAIFDALTAGLFGLDEDKYDVSGDHSPADFPNMVKVNMDIFAGCVQKD